VSRTTDELASKSSRSLIISLVALSILILFKANAATRELITRNRPTGHCSVLVQCTLICVELVNGNNGNGKNGNGKLGNGKLENGKKGNR